ncbi:MAG: hypothetical protein EB060_05380 [Proteobacteria bacterium]|nr:hypothetical protein [Pseudomonadota bacterium]
MVLKLSDRTGFVLALLVFIYARFLSYGACLPYDDAYITFLYAENLADGVGFVFNAGERVLGTTTPLYALLASGIYALGFNLVKTMPIVNLLAEIGILTLAWHILLRRQSVVVKLLFASFLTVSPTSGNVSASAMETPVFTLTVMASMVFASRRNMAASGVLAAISYFIRPEGVLAAAVVTLDRFRKGDRKGFWMSATVCASIAALGAVMTYAYFGSIFSQTIIAKTLRNPGDEFYQRLFCREPVQILSFILALVGVRTAWKKEASLRLFLMFCGAYLLAYILVHPWIRIWYVYPPYIGIFLCAAIGVQELANRIRFKKLQALSLPLLIASVIASRVLWLEIYPRSAYSKQKQYDNVYAPLKAWCRAEKPKSIFAADVGQLGYFCRQAYIMDASALVWKPALGYITESDGFIRVIEDFKPAYVFSNNVKWQTMQMRLLQDQYTPYRRFSYDGNVKIQDMSKMYEESDYQRWSPDYYLYKRKAGADKK